MAARNSGRSRKCSYTFSMAPPIRAPRTAPVPSTESEETPRASVRPAISEDEREARIAAAIERVSVEHDELFARLAK